MTKPVRLKQLTAWLATPVSIIVTFAIGMAATWLPTIPHEVTSPLGPNLSAIGRPLSLEIPSLGVKAPIVPIDLGDDNVLTPPSDVSMVGWWRRSAQPGSNQGQTLITGHSAHAAMSPMNHLRTIRPGASVLIRARSKTASYLVRQVFVWSKKQVAEHAADLFDPDRHSRRLVLVTSANYDGRVWRGNVIVYALPL